MTKKNVYAVDIGRTRGIFSAWEGKDGAKESIYRYPNARYKGFATTTEAEAWLIEPWMNPATPAPVKNTTPTKLPSIPEPVANPDEKMGKRERSATPPQT